MWGMVTMCDRVFDDEKACEIKTFVYFVCFRILIDREIKIFSCLGLEIGFHLGEDASQIPPKDVNQSSLHSRAHSRH